MVDDGWWMARVEYCTMDSVDVANLSTCAYAHPPPSNHSVISLQVVDPTALAAAEAMRVNQVRAVWCAAA